jgi:hypothetical protein
MRGRAISNSRHSSLSGRRCASPTGARFKQHLLVVGIELPYGEAAAAREPAEGVGEPNGQARQVVDLKKLLSKPVSISRKTIAERSASGALVKVLPWSVAN